MRSDKTEKTNLKQKSSSQRSNIQPENSPVFNESLAAENKHDLPTTALEDNEELEELRLLIPDQRDETVDDGEGISNRRSSRVVANFNVTQHPNLADTQTRTTQITLSSSNLDLSTTPRPEPATEEIVINIHNDMPPIKLEIQQQSESTTKPREIAKTSRSSPSSSSSQTRSLFAANDPQPRSFTTPIIEEQLSTSDNDQPSPPPYTTTFFSTLKGYDPSQSFSREAANTPVLEPKGTGSHKPKEEDPPVSP